MRTTLDLDDDVLEAARAMSERRDQSLGAVISGLARSQSAYPDSLGTAAAMQAVLQAFCADPRHEFCADDIPLLDDAHLTRPDLLTPSLVTDLYLLALARHHHARLASFDKRIPAEATYGGSAALTLLDA